MSSELEAEPLLRFALDKILTGLAQAERGEFVADEEMDTLFAEHAALEAPLYPPSTRGERANPNNLMPELDVGVRTLTPTYRP